MELSEERSEEWPRMLFDEFGPELWVLGNMPVREGEDCGRDRDNVPGWTCLILSLIFIKNNTSASICQFNVALLVSKHEPELKHLTLCYIWHIHIYQPDFSFHNCFSCSFIIISCPNDDIDRRGRVWMARSIYLIAPTALFLSCAPHINLNQWWRWLRQIWEEFKAWVTKFVH